MTAEIIDQAYDVWYELNEEWPYNDDLVRLSLPIFFLDALLDGADRVALVRTVDGVQVVRQEPYVTFVVAEWPGHQTRCYHLDTEACRVEHTAKDIVAWVDGARLNVTMTALEAENHALRERLNR